MGSVREWVTQGVKNGGTPRWIFTMAIKGLVEIGFSLLFAAVMVYFADRLFGLPEVEWYGISGRQGAFLAFSGMIWRLWVLCRYTDGLE